MVTASNRHIWAFSLFTSSSKLCHGNVATEVCGEETNVPQATESSRNTTSGQGDVRESGQIKKSCEKRVPANTAMETRRFCHQRRFHKLHSDSGSRGGSSSPAVPKEGRYGSGHRDCNWRILEATTPIHSRVATGERTMTAMRRCKTTSKTNITTRRRPNHQHLRPSITQLHNLRKNGL